MLGQTPIAPHLEGHGVSDRQKDSEGQACLVGSVTPEAVGSCGDAQGADQVVPKCCLPEGRRKSEGEKVSVHFFFVHCFECTFPSM